MITKPLIKREAIDRLHTQLSGTVIQPGDAEYARSRRLWNGAVNKQPAIIVRCRDERDVLRAVRFATEHELPLAVRAGGHDHAGRALRDGGLVIDLSALRMVTIDPVARVARVQGGATAGDLIHAARPYGLATTTGTVQGVGMAGLTLGGGYGPLIGKYGLVLDNLLAADVVMADGRVLTASASEHADLFWGLRGGGGNFGVVTAFSYRLHPISTVLAGLVLYPIQQARDMLRFHREFSATLPDELTVMTGFMQTPEGLPAPFLFPIYCGPVEEGERALAPLRAFGSPLVAQVAPMAYADLITQFDAGFPTGRHYRLDTQSLETLDDAAIEVLIQSAREFTSPFSAIALHQFHGAASRVDVGETAFAARRDHLMVEILAAWEPHGTARDRTHAEWSRATSRALAPHALPGGYTNLIDETERERVPLAYGPNYARLLALKRLYDPTNVFSSAASALAEQ